MRPHLATFAALVLGSMGIATFADDGVPADEPNDVELHAVCVYEGEKDSGFVRVLVDRPGRNVVLYVAAYETAAWNVTTTPETKLVRVIAGGYEPQELGVPTGVEIVEAWRGKRDRYLGYALGKDRRRPSFRKFVATVTNAIGRDRLASFQSTYSPEVGRSFVVDAVDRDELLLAAYPFVAKREEIPPDARDLVVRTEFYDSNQGQLATQASLVEFGLFGPRTDSKTKLPKQVTRVAEGGGRTFGIVKHDVVEIDLETGTTTPLVEEEADPGISWPSDIAYDTKRNRLFVHGSAGSRLFAYDVPTKSWSTLAERIGAAQLAYSAEEDCIYSLGHDRKGLRRLKQLDVKGRVLRTIDLDGPLVSAELGIMPGVTRTRIECVGDYLVVITSSPNRLDKASGSPDRRVHLVDPKTGQSWLTWRSKTSTEADEATE